MKTIQIFLCVILFASCSRDEETIGDTEDLTQTGQYTSGHCDVHDRDFLEEKVPSLSETPPNNPSVSAEYALAERTLHPNHNSWPYAHNPDERIKWALRRYCPDCRESLKTWINNNKKPNKAEEPTPNPPSD